MYVYHQRFNIAQYFDWYIYREHIASAMRLASISYNYCEVGLRNVDPMTK